MKKLYILIFSMLCICGCTGNEIVILEKEDSGTELPNGNDGDNSDEPIEQLVYPRLILKADMYDIYKQRFLALPEGSQAKKNKIINAWFSDNEDNKKAATLEFVNYWKGYSNEWTDANLQGSGNGVSLRGVWRTIHLYDIVKSFGYLSSADESEFKLALRSAIKRSTDRERDPEILDDYTKSLNIYTDVYLAAGLVGLVFPDLPESKAWVEYSLRELKWQLEHSVCDIYSWHESPRYQVYVLKIMGQFMEIYKNVTGEDLFQNDILKNLTRWFIIYNTPFDKVAGNNVGKPNGVKLIPAIGDTAWGENLAPLNLFASHYVNSDPELSSQLMWIWKNSGYLSSEEPVLDLLIDNDIPSSEPTEMGSFMSEKKGYVLMRSDFNTDAEKWLMLKSGIISHHEHGDKNSFSLIAYGTPFLLDSGTGDYGDPLHKSWHNKSFSHNMVVFKPVTENAILNYESQNSNAFDEEGVVDFWDTNIDYDFVRMDASKASRVNENIREVLFVKPDYFIIRDIVDAGSISKKSVYMLQTPCDEVTMSDQDNYIECKNNSLNTSLRVHILKKGVENLKKDEGMHFGTWTEQKPDNNQSLYPMKYITTLEIPGPSSKGEILTVLHPKKEGVNDLNITYDENNQTIKIIKDSRTDEIEFISDGINLKKGDKEFKITIK